MSRPFKYSDLLGQYSNCPPDDYKELSKLACRWVHNYAQHENDFKPLNLINNPPPRMLDDSDKMCMGYGLSFFNTCEDAIKKYKTIYNKQRPKQKKTFLEEKGDTIAHINLEVSDGTSSEPNNEGHFTFHEYVDTNLSTKIVNLTAIFDEHGNFRKC